MKLKEARREADDLLKRVEQSEDPHAIKVEADEAPTFATLAARYMIEYSNPETSAIHGNKGKRTWSQDQNKLDAVLLPAWGKLKAWDITRAHVIKLLKGIVAEGKPAWANRSTRSFRPSSTSQSMMRLRSSLPTQLPSCGAVG
jgi:hypothetical protein